MYTTTARANGADCLKRDVRQRGYAAIGLENPKMHENVGSALRACHCYGAKMLAFTGNRYRRHGTDTPKAYRHMPMLQVESLKDVIPYDCVPVAIDLIEGATPLNEYQHPERAFYIFGPEEGTLGSRVTAWCRDVVYVPTRDCMNLAATVNVVLYDRTAKSLNAQQVWKEGK